MASNTSELHLTPEAQADLLAIKTYISKDLENPVAALSTLKRITQTIRLLRGQALIGTPLSAIADLRNDEGYRYLTSGSYMIFYIDRILYGGRDYLRALGLEPSPET